MANRIELPTLQAGKPEEQLQTLYNYLVRMAQDLNYNFSQIGGTEFTDQEMIVIRDVIGEEATATDGRAEAETLKSLIIKTAQFVKSEIDQYNLRLFGNYEAEGRFGRYVRKTQLDVDVTPTGIRQDYTFAEIIQGLKTYEINAKNYIYTGLLRTVQSIPVYGVAIGKDVVTFSEDGTETYTDSNKVAELTADELSFYQGGSKIASYKGNRISFFYNGSECFYIASGKIYCAQDLELASGKKLIINTSNFKIDSSGNVTIKGDGEFSGTVKAGAVIACDISADRVTSGTMSANRVRGGEIAAGGNNNGNGIIKIYDASGSQIGKWDKDGIQASNGTFNGNVQGANVTGSNIAGGSISGTNINADHLTVNGIDFTTRFHIGPSAPPSGNGTIWFKLSDVSSVTWSGQADGGMFIGHNESVVTYTKAISRQGSQNVTGNGPYKYKITATIKNGGTNPVQLRCRLTKGSSNVLLSGDVAVHTGTVANVTLTGSSNTNLGADSGNITVKFFTNGPWNNTYIWDGLISLNIESTNGGSGNTQISEILYVP